MLISYKEKRFNASSALIIQQANEIITEYEEQNFDLTLRQLYYQFVARGLLENSVKNYKRFGVIISDARLAGLISWQSITDRTRQLDKFVAWDSPKDILSACINQYKENPWKLQESYVEVWVEKEALISVVKIGCEPYRVPHFACRGYVSQSEMWTASTRFLANQKEGKESIILHFGDHDPSGIDMTRDIIDRMGMFGVSNLSVHRLALNFDQIEEFSPPPNPAKEVDPRFESYKDNYGLESWELDALDPKTIVELIRKHLRRYIDVSLWKIYEEREAQNIKKLKKVLGDLK